MKTKRPFLLLTLLLSACWPADYNLPRIERKFRDGSYYLKHGICFNTHFEPKDTLASEFGLLAKDTSLGYGLRYAIWVWPNTGW